MCNPKNEGGIGLLNVYTKAKSIFTATTLKMIQNTQKNEIIEYYMYERIHKYIEMEVRPNYTSKTIPPYYDYGLTNIKKIHKMPKFPTFSSKEIYNELRVKKAKS